MTGSRYAQHLAPIQGGQITGAELDQSLFPAFVEWIGRGEKTTRSYLTNLKQFAAWLAYSSIGSPTRQDILAYKEWLAAEHDAIRLDTVTGWSYRTDAHGEPLRITCRANTRAQYLRTVCAFFRWTAACGYYPNIADNIHPPKVNAATHRKEALTAAQVLAVERSIEAHGALLEQAAQEAAKDKAGKIQRSAEQSRRLYAIYLLAVNAGLRTVEISRANIKDLVSSGGQAWLYVWGKGREEPDQKKPLAPEVAAAVKEYVRARTDRPTGSSPLFVATGNRSGGRRLDPVTISKLLKKALQAAGFDSERITAHSLRHSCGTAVMELTGNVYTAQQYMRHSSPATTEIYLHNETEAKDAATARQLYALYHGAPDHRAQLERILDTMSGPELEKLAGIAADLAKTGEKAGKSPEYRQQQRPG